MGKSDNKERITLLERSFDLIEYILKHSSLDGENYLQSINNFIDALKEKSPDDFEKKVLEEARIKINSLSLDELKEMQELISDEFSEEELTEESNSLITKLMRTDNGSTFEVPVNGNKKVFLMKMKICHDSKLYFMMSPVEDENLGEIMFFEYLSNDSNDGETLKKVEDDQLLKKLSEASI